ncbi:hypothetical protein BDY21DRAFT_386418 [Lineolata rhizophorae]|uniref:DUF7708 domain-containing protein n=1 Tax=Lineolata rhizophorae TaxID=578093 RepID=A0A6A6NXF8_9PEZI|nr:hypothetical protein BDY21DRAFT_386418 [Lineolata rhizophorae]
MLRSTVLHLLAQHHPQYVALAWGTAKFVLVGIINHENLVVQLCQALCNIGDALPRAKITAELYKTDQMKDAISRLYAHILLFFQQAVKWYNRSPAGRVLSSIFKPFELEYKDNLEQIRICAKRVDDTANTAARAEIRDIHILAGLQEKWRAETDRKLLDMQGHHKAISEETRVDVREMKPLIIDIHFKQVMDVLAPKILPEDALRKSQSLVRRGAKFNSVPQDITELLQRIGEWMAKPDSALFVLRASVIALLQPAAPKVLWYLSGPNIQKDTSPATKDVLKSLVFQALKLVPDIVSRNLEHLNAAKMCSEHTEAEWLDLLTAILNQLRKCFIVIEAEDVFRSSSENVEWAATFIGLFQTIVDRAADNGCVVKILVVSYGSAAPRLPNPSNRTVFSVQRPMPVPPHLGRVSRTAAAKTTAWRNLRARI